MPEFTTMQQAFFAGLAIYLGLAAFLLSIKDDSSEPDAAQA